MDSRRGGLLSTEQPATRLPQRLGLRSRLWRTVVVRRLERVVVVDVQLGFDLQQAYGVVKLPVELLALIALNVTCCVEVSL